LVVALLALFVAIGGRAYAAATSSNGAPAANPSATGPTTTQRVFYAPKTKSATPTTILRVGGLTLTATCGNGDLEVVMTSAFDHAHLSSEMWNSAGDGGADGLHHSDFGPNSAIRLESLGDGNAWGETSFTYTRPNGTIVSGRLSFDSSDLNPFHPGDGDIFDHKAACLVSGFATSSVVT
jgi:hypothetical protein